MLSKHETLGLYCRCRRHPFMVSEPKTYGFGTENVKGRLLETDFYTFRQNIDSWLDKQTIELN
jgi:hypothetical protein